MTTCEGCGFVYGDLPVEHVPAVLREAVPRYRELLTSTSPSVLLARPDASTWSALEYACHVRDVLLVQRDRAVRALVEEVPEFPPMHREQRVDILGYRDEPPGLVAEEIAMATGLLTRLLDRLDEGRLGRRCVYGYPTPTEVDLAWLGRHTVHEVDHHLLDVRRVLGLGGA